MKRLGRGVPAHDRPAVSGRRRAAMKHRRLPVRRAARSRTRPLPRTVEAFELLRVNVRYRRGVQAEVDAARHELLEPPSPRHRRWDSVYPWRRTPGERRGAQAARRWRGMRSAPTSRAAMMADRPTPPVPKMAIESPAPTFSALITAPEPVIRAAAERAEQVERHVLRHFHGCAAIRN